MIDGIVLAVIALAAVFGFFRGVISQLMALGGLAAAWLLAPSWGKLAAGFVQHQLGCSKFMAGKVSIFVIGVLIYVAARLIGYGIERILVSRTGEFKSLNRLGGAALGALKAVVIAALVFFLLALIPRQDVRAWFPRIMDSRSYQLAAKYNPMGKQAVLERMREVRTSISDPKKMARLKDSDQAEEILSRYDLKGAFHDPRFVESFKEGDYDALAKNEQVERLMKDDQLTTLLEGLEQDSAKN